MTRFSFPMAPYHKVLVEAVDRAERVAPLTYRRPSVARKREDTPIEKHTLHLYEGDFVKLQVLHPNNSAAKIIRSLVRAHIARVEAAANEKATA